jgi:hypothetical protein
MRTWERLAVPAKCGRCGEDLPFNTPVQRIHFEHGLKPATRRPLRCPRCAEGEPPEDLPEAVVNKGAPIEPQPLVRFGAAMLPLDFKHGGRR